MKLHGISGAVNVYRDAAGIPHILADNEFDAYVAAGYVHAQDRLWQMDLLRRYGMGRLAEIFGSEALPIDRMMRTVGIHRIADSLFASVSGQTRKILSAYSRGVNAGIRERRGSLPIEFDLLRYEPEEWTPVHSLILVRLIGWELALSWWTDLTLGELIARFGEEKARQIFPGEANGSPVIQPGAGEERGMSAQLLRDGMAAAHTLFGLQGSAIGSNAWVVTGKRSASGKPLLANDPHLLAAQPARWYAMHLSAPGLNVAGVSLPGIPGIVIGHNGCIAWGMTNLMADDVDFFVERISYKDSTCIDDGRAVRMSIWTDSIFVRDGLPVLHTVWRSSRGPIITPVYPLSGVIRDSGRFAPPTAVSMRWAGQDASDEVLAMYRANHASNWREFQTAYSTFGVPAQHVVYADTSGTIAGLAVGRIPIRGSGQPMLPSRGWEAGAGWRGYVPWEQMPRSQNPNQGVLVAANNRLVASFPWHISNLYEGDARALRIHDMLDGQPYFTANDFRLMQMDALSPYADSLRRVFVSALRSWNTRPLLITRVMNLLAHWDGRMNASSVEAAIFNVAWVHVLRRTFGDEMDSTLFSNYTFIANIPTRVLPRLLADTTALWFDDVRTPGRETKRHVFIRGITDAVAELREKFGSNMQKWRWGELHMVEFKHPVGQHAPLNKLFNIGPFNMSGNNTTVSNSEYSFSHPYDVRVVASMRFVADLSSPDSSYIILTTGQSGQPFSRHYADHTALWQTGAMHRLIIDNDAIRRAGWKRLELKP